MATLLLFVLAAPSGRTQKLRSEPQLCGFLEMGQKRGEVNRRRVRRTSAACGFPAKRGAHDPQPHYGQILGRQNEAEREHPGAEDKQDGEKAAKNQGQAGGD